MPIKPENRDHYPHDWKAISARIRFVRAEGRCECIGECGLHQGRCRRRHGEIERREIPRGNSWEFKEVKIVLTVAHRVHGPDCSDENLMAMCQGCHLNFDAKMHASNARKSAAKKAGQGEMWKP